MSVNFINHDICVTGCNCTCMSTDSINHDTWFRYLLKYTIFSSTFQYSIHVGHFRARRRKSQNCSMDFTAGDKHKNKRFRLKKNRWSRCTPLNPPIISDLWLGTLHDVYLSSIVAQLEVCITEGLGFEDEKSWIGLSRVLAPLSPNHV